MIKKSIKIAIQRLLMFKAYSSINIGGLAIAISVCLAILLFSLHHFSFDKSISNGENSYRIISRYGDGSYNANTFACFDDVLNDYPEVKSHTIVYANHNIEEVMVGDAKIKVNDAFFANSSFLDYFSVKMIRGTKASINRPNTMMITPAMAKRLFPEEDAIGQTVMFRSFTNNQDSLIAFSITGIVKPMPDNSHIKYEMLLSQKGHFSPTVKTFKSRKAFASLIYVKLYSSANIEELSKSLQTKVEPILGGKHGPPLEAFNHQLQPVYDIHFTQGLNNEMQPTVRRSSLNILLMVCFLIFAIAIINFVIMHIARVTFHQKATLIMRFLGGNKMSLFSQTLIEVTIAVSISFLMAILFLATFKITLAEHFFAHWIISFQNPAFWIITICLFLVVIVLVSILSSLNLLRNDTIIREAIKPKGIKAAIPLVIFQFVMVIAIIGFAILLNLQMNFIDNKELGYSSENVIVIKIPQTNAKINVFREALLKAPNIKSTGTAQHYPGYRFQDMNLSDGDNAFPFKFGFIDQHAIQTLNIKPLKYFSDLKDEASNGWMINETFYNHLKSKYSDQQIADGMLPMGKSETDQSNSTRFVMLGVMRNFHYASLHSKIDNFAFYIPTPNTRYYRYVLARFDQKKVKEVIATINNRMTEIYHGQPVIYSFLDEKLANQYASEQILLKLINAFSILAIFVASLGLMGLSIFVTEKRTKEIGIRKVNGSKVNEIVLMLCKDFIKWVSIAFVIATPIAYYLSQKWLQNFAYKTALSWWIFALAGVFAMMIALITVSWQTFRAARKNPVEALRYE